jgi:signal transduction histidine kinase
MTNLRHPGGGLRRKIWIAFIVQVAAISFATVLGVYGASAVLKHLLIQRALTDEAAHFWQRLASDPQAQAPDTFNMMGYLLAPDITDDALPKSLRGLHPGYHSLPRAQGGSLVLVDRKPAGTLVLVFKQEQVDALAFWFGVVPLILVLLLIYLVAWATYRVSRRAVSPVIWLANVVERWDPKRPDADALNPQNLPLDVEGETLVLAKSLHGFASRIERFVEREGNFTRDASHELRTPMTVIRMACDLLLADGSLDAHAQRSVQRIQAATRDMLALVEAFLILAREGDTGLPDEDFMVNDIVRDEVEKARPLLLDKPVQLQIDEQAAFGLHAPPRVLSVLLGNLLRNACLYTESGSITVRIVAAELQVIDTGVGIRADELARVFDPFYRAQQGQRDGHGIGLSIVRRLSERFGWPVSLESEPGKGTVARIRFPDSKQLGV